MVTIEQALTDKMQSLQTVKENHLAREKRQIPEKDYAYQY